jgi:hypothetical protein
LFFWSVRPECGLVDGIKSLLWERVLEVLQGHLFEWQNVVPFSDGCLILGDLLVGCIDECLDFLCLKEKSNVLSRRKVE